MPAPAEIGVFGGSGFYEWFSGAELVTMETPYGTPSAPISVADVAGRRVAFLPRHGPRHTIPAPFVNYRANVWAMHELGVRRIIGPSAVGSLQPDLHPGDLVICDQFIDRTSGRSDTYYPGPEVVHISAADPYCPELRALAGGVAREQAMRFRPAGTVVVVQGPRFSTRAESRWYGRMGWDIVGMTQYPEVILARELQMCYLNLSLVTDYDATFSPPSFRSSPGLRAATASVRCKAPACDPPAGIHRTELASRARMRAIRALAPVRARLRIDGCAPSRARRRLRLISPRIPICGARPVEPGYKRRKAEIGVSAFKEGEAGSRYLWRC